MKKNTSTQIITNWGWRRGKVPPGSLIPAALLLFTITTSQPRTHNYYASLSPRSKPGRGGPPPPPHSLTPLTQLTSLHSITYLLCPPVPVKWGRDGLRTRRRSCKAHPGRGLGFSTLSGYHLLPLLALLSLPLPSIFASATLPRPVRRPSGSRRFYKIYGNCGIRICALSTFLDQGSNSNRVPMSPPLGTGVPCPPPPAPGGGGRGYNGW